MRNVLLTGIGGQGTVLAAKLLAQAAQARGWQVRTAETIGMAQRGGSVVSHIRMGDGGEPCVFVDMRFAVMPGDEELRAFSVELAGLFADALGVDVNQMYFNFGTMPYCATGSVLAPEQR